MTQLPQGFEPDAPDGFIPDTPTQVPDQSSKGALIGAAISKGLPVAANLAERFATNPNVPKVAATVGRWAGGLTPPVVGAMKYGPAGFAYGLGTAAGGAWSGGKTGWFTGKLAQRVALPIAKALESAAPYLRTLTTVSGVQGVNDLAQMVDPKRTDIGFLGIGPTQPEPTPEGVAARKVEEDAAREAHPQQTFGEQLDALGHILHPAAVRQLEHDIAGAIERALGRTKK